MPSGFTLEDQTAALRLTLRTLKEDWPRPEELQWAEVRLPFLDLLRPALGLATNRELRSILARAGPAAPLPESRHRECQEDTGTENLVVAGKVKLRRKAPAIKTSTQVNVEKIKM